MRHIQLRRENQVISEFDLYQLLMTGDKSKDSQLAPGDVIFIPPARGHIALTGSVEHPAIYEIAPHTSVADALRLGDGLTPLASRSQILIERIGKEEGLEEIHLEMNSAGLQTEVCDGDIIRLLPLVPRFQNAVTLRGNVANSGPLPLAERNAG